MCGIVYSKSLIGKPVNNVIKHLYNNQKNRGRDGFGFYSPEFNRLTHSPKEGRIMNLLRRNKKATEILFHHRMPTSTINVRNACHPFSTKDVFQNNYIIVHNGVLYNEDSLKKEHEALGIKYVSEMRDGSYNDSEALAYDIARYLEGHVDKISAQGSIAFIAIKNDKDGNPAGVYFGRNSGNPLIMNLTDRMFNLSSQGKGTLIDPNTMYYYDYKEGKLSNQACVFPLSSYYGNYQGYGSGYGWQDDDYMYQRPTSQNTQDYFDAEKSFIKTERDRLMNDAYEHRETAIDLGQEEVVGIGNRIKHLRERIDIWAGENEEDVESLADLETSLYYIKEAVKMLIEEVQTALPFGFHDREVRYTPAGEAYRFLRSDREARSGAGTIERPSFEGDFPTRAGEIITYRPYA